MTTRTLVYRRYEADLDEALLEGADDSTRRVMEQIAAHRAGAHGPGRPLTLLRSPR